MKWPLKINRRLNGVLIAFLLSGVFILLAVHGTFAKDPETGAPAERAEKDYAPFPQPDAGYVTDDADLLSDAREEKIEQWLWRIEKKTGVEVIVVTISSIRDYPGTPNRSIEAFATALFDTYGIGNPPRNDGVLLLVSLKDRKARIELGAGYGRARDADARRIMDGVIIPRFKEADYAGGIIEGVRAIAVTFAGIRIGPNWPLIILAGLLPILALISYSLFKSGKKGWGWVAVGTMIIVLIAMVWLIVRIIREAPGSSASWRSGGLGGFGGGFSGGGGATGSW